MLTDIVVKNICDKEIRKAIENISSFVECQYTWENKEFMDYEMFRFANPLFYNAKHQIDFAEDESEKMIVRVLKSLFCESGYIVENIFDNNFNYANLLSGFIIYSDSCKKTGFCFMKNVGYVDWKKLQNETGFEDLNVVFFSTQIDFKFDEKYEKEGVIKKIYKRNNLHTLFEQYFCSNIYTIFMNAVNEYVNKINNKIGIITVATTSNIQTVYLKKIIEEEVIKKDYKNQPFWRILVKKSFNAYDGKEKIRISKKTNNLRDDKFNRIIKQYIDDRYYQVLFGNSDFAKSLLSSEWLFHSYKSMINTDSEEYDFTPIICGYLKSMEQLVFLFMKCLANKGYYAQAKKGVKNQLEMDGIVGVNRDEKYIDIEITDSSLKYIDSQLGSCGLFLKQKNTKHVVLKSSSNEIYKLLNDFREECRNGYFHTDNVYNWKQIEKIRENAFYLYFLLLGDCNISIENENLQVRFKSKYEDFCDTISEYHPLKNRTYMVKNNIVQEITIDADEVVPVYHNGIRKFTYIPISLIERKNPNSELAFITETMTISENDMPNEIYIIDKDTGKRNIIWKT